MNDHNNSLFLVEGILPNVGYYFQMKEIYGTAILLFYFMKWSLALGVPLLHFVCGLKSNLIFNCLLVFDPRSDGQGSMDRVA